MSRKVDWEALGLLAVVFVCVCLFAGGILAIRAVFGDAVTLVVVLVISAAVVYSACSEPPS